MTALNPLLAFIGAILAFCAVDRMDRSTAHAIRAAVVLVGVGLLGQALGAWTDRWAPHLDTLLYGGLIAYLLACRRLNLTVPIGLTYDQAQHLSIAVSAGTFCWFFIAISFSPH